MFIISGTGHRPPKLGGYVPNPTRAYIKHEMLRIVSDTIATTDEEVGIVWGGALGFDQHMAELANYLDLPHVAILPFSGMDARWPIESQRHWKDLCASTDLTMATAILQDHPDLGLQRGNLGTLYTSTEPYRHNGQYQVRNEALVAVADFLLACWDGSTGGTANCLAHAHFTRPDLPIHIITPQEA